MPVRRHDPPRRRGIVLIALQQREGRLTHPSGNITRISDNARQGVCFANAHVTPDPSFTYDPTYRLIRASTPS